MDTVPKIIRRVWGADDDVGDVDGDDYDYDYDDESD